MLSRVLWLILLAACGGCGASDDARSDAAVQAAANLGTPPSPSASLLKELSKGQPDGGPVDAKQNERNARMLPQVLTNSNEAIRRIQNGDDPEKVVADLQRQNASLGN